MFRHIGKIITGVVGILIIAVMTVHFKFKSQQNEHIAFEPASIILPTDVASLNEGRRLVQLKGCYDCHGSDMAGKVFAEAGPVGRFVGSNLTSAGVTKDYQVTDWIRAIRYGLAKDGRKLIFMPSAEFAQMTDEDMVKMIAYLQTVPAVESNNPSLEVGPLAKLLYLAGNFPLMFQSELINRDEAPLQTITVDTSIAYGKYLAASCTGCHGMNMKGGIIPGVPPEWPAAADLTKTGNVQKWTKYEFETTMRTGRRPDGHQINPQFMPWTSFAAMTDTEMSAVFNYIQSL